MSLWSSRRRTCASWRSSNRDPQLPVPRAARRRAAAWSSPSSEAGLARAKLKSSSDHAGNTCTCRCGTSRPAMTRPARGAPKASLAAFADPLGDVHAVAQQRPVGIGPLVHFPPWHDQRVAGVERHDRQERDDLIIGIDEPARQLAGDDTGEHCSHRTPFAAARRPAHKLQRAVLDDMPTTDKKVVLAAYLAAQGIRAGREVWEYGADDAG